MSTQILRTSKHHFRRSCRLLALLSVLFALSLCVRLGIAQEPKLEFVGSESCKGCHAEAYNGWKKTRMANVIRNPKVHPEAVLGDFSHADSLRPFDLDQVALVYGSRFKQRYFTKRGDDYYPLQAQWDVKKGKWLPYHVEAGTDWWVPFPLPGRGYWAKKAANQPSRLRTCERPYRQFLREFNVQSVCIHFKVSWNLKCRKLLI